MNEVMPWLIIGAAFATVAVLVAGIVNMLRGKGQNPRRANLLMRWRVGLQAAAVALLVLFMLIMGH